MNPLIQGLFNEFRKSEELQTLGESDAFELFCANLVLRDELLGQVEGTDLLLDSATIGVDIAVLEVNGQIVWDPGDVIELCGSTGQIDVTLHLLQAKRSASISGPDLLNFGHVAIRVLDNDPGLAQFTQLSGVAQALRSIFDDYAGRLRSLPAVSLTFATTASSVSVVDSQVLDKVASVQQRIDALDYVGLVTFDVLGADRLHQAWIKKNKANEVEIQLEKQVNLPKMPGIDQAILGVVSIRELLKLVQDDEGSLDERVFYDNVRGFKGHDNPVNKQILDTLATSGRELLPVLNNGVTVVAASYAPKPGDSVAISGFQVVNGCQTSHCLYLSQEVLATALDTVFVPIRLVVTNDEDVATRIIRATNSQTEVGENDLVALTKFQRKLEDYYRLDPKDVKLTYERRSGQFYGKDVTKTRLVTIGDQMRAVSAIFLSLPHVAARYTQRLYGDVGEAIFREDHQLLPYISSAFAAYRLENAFRAGLDPSFKPARYHILMAAMWGVAGGPLAKLNSHAANDQSDVIIAALKSPNHVDLFRAAAARIIDVAGGQMPTRDRLKRQQFTQDLARSLGRSVRDE